MVLLLCRQGDPGSTRYFLSLEDNLFRIFGGDRIKSLMQTLGVGDLPIESKMLTNSLSEAQRKVSISDRTRFFSNAFQSQSSLKVKMVSEHYTSKTQHDLLLLETPLRFHPAACPVMPECSVVNREPLCI